MATGVCKKRWCNRFRGNIHLSGFIFVIAHYSLFPSLSLSVSLKWSFLLFCLFVLQPCLCSLSVSSSHLCMLLSVSSLDSLSFSTPTITSSLLFLCLPPFLSLRLCFLWTAEKLSAACFYFQYSRETHRWKLVRTERQTQKGHRGSDR